MVERASLKGKKTQLPRDSNILFGIKGEWGNPTHNSGGHPTVNLCFVQGKLNIVLFLKALFEIWESDRNSHPRFFLT